MKISGGASLGYWEMGRPRSATTPTITMTMEITMATMGRLMKKRAMSLPLLLPGGGGWRTGRRLLLKRLRGDGHTGPDFLDAFHNHALARLQAFIHHPPGSGASPHRAPPEVHLVVRTHYGHLVSPLQLGDRPLGNQQRPLLRLDQGP